MHIHLSVILADILGTTGHASMRAIVPGARDPGAWARRRPPAGHSSAATLAKALSGTWHAAPLFGLQHALARFDFDPEHIPAGAAQLAASLRALEPRRAGAPPPAMPPAQPTARARKQPRFNARAEFVGITGVDLVAVTGRAAASVQTIRSEIGTEMTRFPSSKHCCSWLGLAPHNDLSGGKILRAHPRKGVQRAAQAFRQAAQSVARSDSVCGAYYRVMRARLGPQQAMVATAPNIARVFYHLLQDQEAFTPERMEVYEQRRREREIKQLMRRANRLGYALTPVTSDDEHARPKSSEGDVA
jgi:transposase